MLASTWHFLASSIVAAAVAGSRWLQGSELGSVVTQACGSSAIACRFAFRRCASIRCYSDMDRATGPAGEQARPKRRLPLGQGKALLERTRVVLVTNLGSNRGGVAISVWSGGVALERNVSVPL